MRTAAMGQAHLQTQDDHNGYPELQAFQCHPKMLPFARLGLGTGAVAGRKGSRMIDRSMVVLQRWQRRMICVCM